MKKIFAISFAILAVYAAISSATTSTASAVLKNGLSSTDQKIEAIQ